MLKYLQIFPETRTLVKRYPAADRGLLYEAMMDYAFEGTEPAWDDSDMKWYVWNALKQEVIRAEKAIQRKSEAGKASARQRESTQVNRGQQTSTEVNTSQQWSTEVNPNTNTKPKSNTNTDTESNDLGKRRRFTPPTRDEVAAYIAEKGYNVDPDHWMAHYESNGWKVGSNPMKDWRAAVRTWARNDMNRSRQDQPRKVTAQQYEQRQYTKEEDDAIGLEWMDYVKKEGTA